MAAHDARLTFFDGLGAWGTALKFLYKHRLWRYLVWTAVIAISYFILLIYVGFSVVPVLGELLHAQFQAEFSETWLQMIAVVLYVMVGFVTWKHITLFLATPILSKLSEEVIRLTANETPEEAPALWGIKRNVFLTVRHIFWEIVLTILALVTTFIPIAGAISAPFLSFVVQSYYAGAGLSDNPLEQNRLNYRRTNKFTRKYRSFHIGLGTGFVLLSMIPFLGWMLAPTLGTIASAIALQPVLEVSNKSK